MIKKLLLPAFLLLCNLHLSAQTPQDATVALSATVAISPPGITLNWPLTGMADIQLKRRTKGQLGSQWTQLLNLTAATQTSLTDLNITSGATYEYHIRIVVNGTTAHGYAHVAVLAPLVDYRGKILIFIDSTTADAVGLELKIFKDAMRGDGWQPITNHTGPSSTVESIKNQIKAYYTADPASVKAVLLIGTVPIPYSGDANWDGHPDHAGAWPSDAYYADINGTWTDAVINDITPGREANKNIPGDGKFDQSYLPTPAELMVGRIDFRRLSPTTFGASPTALTKRYLLKSARWRTKQYTVPYRALVDDNFGYFNGEAFAANGFRNAYPIVGNGNISSGDFLNDTGGEGYLLGYATGPGSYNSAGGVGSSSDMASDSINVVFSNIFGSYHGDWDYETDPLMPAALASKGAILTCSWAGRPQWFMQALASGETIGYCTKETMNAQTNTEYFNSSGRGGAHVALLGDPTTRAIIVAQVPDLTFAPHCNSIDLQWIASPDTGILGYHVYRSAGIDGPYTRLTTDWVNGLVWTDNSPPNGMLFYQVRAVRIDQTPGGGIFYNASSGIIRFITFQQGVPPMVEFQPLVLSCNTPFLQFTLPILPNIIYEYNGQVLQGGESITFSGAGTFSLTVINASTGCSSISSIIVGSDTNMPVVQAGPNPAVLTCLTPSITLTASSNIPTVSFQWPGAGNTVTVPGEYCVTATNIQNGCTASACVTVTALQETPVIQATVNDVTSQGASNGAISLTVILPAGSTGAAYNWSNGALTGNITGLPAGTYTVTVTGDNGCQAIQSIVVGTITGTSDPNAGITIIIAPNPASDFTRITLSVLQPAEATLQLMDVNGKQILTQSEGVSPNHTFNVTTHYLADGLYTLFITLGDERIVRQLVVCNSKK
jgi:hypothetical protein